MNHFDNDTTGTVIAAPTPEAWATLQSELTRAQDRENRTREVWDRLRGKVGEFEDRLKEALSSDEIDHDLAREFADIFDITLTKRIRFEGTASFSGTADVPFDFEGDVADSLSIDFSTGWGTSDLDDLDVDVDELRIDSCEDDD